MSYPARCEKCKFLIFENYEQCSIFGGDVLSMSGNGIDFNNCQRFIKGANCITSKSPFFHS